MFRSFAIIPAAGRSARMGVHKLLLPLGDKPLIEHVLRAWSASSVSQTVVVVRPDDPELAAICPRYRVQIVVPPIAPTDMKQSVQLALEYIATNYAPVENDAVLLAPADLPRLLGAMIDSILRQYDPRQAQPIVPCCGGQRGHPVVLPWALAREIHALEPHEGVNALIARTAMREWACQWPQIVEDVDTLEHYGQYVVQWNRDADDSTAGFHR